MGYIPHGQLFRVLLEVRQEPEDSEVVILTRRKHEGTKELDALKSAVEGLYPLLDECVVDAHLVLEKLKLGVAFCKGEGVVTVTEIAQCEKTASNLPRTFLEPSSSLPRASPEPCCGMSTGTR